MGTFQLTNQDIWVVRMEDGRIIQSPWHMAFSEFSEKAHGKCSYHLAKVMKQIEQQREVLDAARQQIISKGAVKNEDGSPKIENGNYVLAEASKEAMLDLFAQTFEVRTIRLSTVINFEDFAAPIYYALGDFIEDDLSDEEDDEQ
jgi:hypothetical protein